MLNRITQRGEYVSALTHQCEISLGAHHHFNRIIVAFLFTGVLCLLSVHQSLADQPTENAAPDQNEDAKAIQIIPGDGMNLAIKEIVNPYYVVVKLTSPVHNMWSGEFENLPTDKPVTIGLSMEGNDTAGNKADVSKWEGLRPVMTYADPMKYETYEWFQKDDQGRWVSGDPFKQGDAKFAGNGKIPEQSVLSKDIAEQFLSADGRYWQAWRDIDKAEAVTTLNIFRVQQKFDNTDFTYAMRIPFTYQYLQQFIIRLREAKKPGVFIDEIGTTQGKRKLQVIRLENPDGVVTPDAQRTVLITAREHATEQATSWGLIGAITFLLSDLPEARVCRKQATWLCVPIEDPDGAVASTFDNITDKWFTCYDPITPPEVLAYSSYLNNYTLKGNTIDLTVSLHNVEANENGPVYCPFIDSQIKGQTIAFNDILYTMLRKDGYLIPETKPYGEGLLSFRLFAWCALRYGSFDLCYELNDRYPDYPLPNARLQRVGQYLTNTITQWLSEPVGIHWHEKVHNILMQHQSNRQKYFAINGKEFEPRTSYEILELAY